MRTPLRRTCARGGAAARTRGDARTLDAPAHAGIATAQEIPMKSSRLIAASLCLLAAPAFANPLAPVTGALANLPVVGPALGNIALPALPALPLPSLPGPGLTGTAAVVVNGMGVIVGVDSGQMPPVSVTTVGLPALPGLPN
jgi:hypothetical protein